MEQANNYKMRIYLMRRHRAARENLDIHAPFTLKKPFTQSRSSQVPLIRLRFKPQALPEQPAQPPPQPRSLPAPLLPRHPLSIAIALSLASAIIFYIAVTANLSGCHLKYCLN